MKRNYILIDVETGEIVGYTIVSDFDTDRDISDSEILEVRLEDAISDGYISSNREYTWEKDNSKIGVLL